MSVRGIDDRDIPDLRGLLRWWRASHGRISPGSSANRPLFWLETWEGVTAAPASGSDFTDERYNVSRQRPQNTGSQAYDEVVVLSTELADLARTVVATSLDEALAHTHLLPVGTPVRVFGLADAIGTIRYVFHRLVNPLFAVLVWRDGGTTDGTKLVPCNRTYTVRSLEATAIDAGGVVLGTQMTPEKNRPAFGKLATAPASGSGEVGTGYFVGSTFHLWDANEQLYPYACPGS